MDRASKAIFALKPVTFRYKKEIDPDRIPQFGLIAEQVEKVSEHRVRILQASSSHRHTLNALLGLLGV